MILVELTAAIDAAGTLQTFYVSTAAFVTSPSDVPANTAFTPSLIDPGSIGLNAFADGKTSGETKLEIGEIVLANADGQYDAWLNYGFDGRAVTIRSGESGAYPAGFPVVLTGTIETLEAGISTVVIRLKDKAFIFQRPALTTRFAGNNSLPAGLEGVAADLKDKVKPKVYGTVYQISPAFVNTSKLSYQVSNGAVNDIAAVYDQGLSITKAGDHATSALLQAATPAAGTYETCFAEGYFRLGTTPAGQITADVVQGAAAGNRTVAQILKQLALDAGVSAGDISSADVTALDTANSSVVGLFLNDETTFANALDMVASSAGAYWSFDPSGVLRMGVLLAPTGTPVVTLYSYDLLKGLERRPAKDNSIPVWSVAVEHTRYFTTQGSDIAGAVTTATRSALALPYRNEKSEDAAIKTQFLLARQMIVQTLLTSAANAATEAARLLALHKVRRDIFDVPVSLDIVTANSLKLTDVVSLVYSRFGLSGGKLFRVIGIRTELKSRRATLVLWG